ncbi:MAG TPA: helix-turn-helix domain-containing protein [Actinomycetes bacterium]
MAESMTITELAEQVGMTPRNIRAYQSRGILFPPRIEGRVARYSGVHAARLQLIASLQREGFTLAAIKRLVDTPGSYAAIVADRRRRFREESSDITPTVPVSEARIRDMFKEAVPDDITETGLVWRDSDGNLVSHTVIVGVGRTLLEMGVPADVVAVLQVEAVRAARSLGAMLRTRLSPSGDDDGHLADLAKVAVQLSATAFEIAFLETATRSAHRGQDPEGQ